MMISIFICKTSYIVSIVNTLKHHSNYIFLVSIKKMDNLSNQYTTIYTKSINILLNIIIFKVFHDKIQVRLPTV